MGPDQPAQPNTIVLTIFGARLRCHHDVAAINARERPSQDAKPLNGTLVPQVAVYIVLGPCSAYADTGPDLPDIEEVVVTGSYAHSLTVATQSKRKADYGLDSINTAEARRHDFSKAKAAIASGAQAISTDYYPGAPDPLHLGFVVTLPNGAMAQCGPVRVAAGCPLQP